MTTAELELRALIERLCELQAEVRDVVGYGRATDCICGRGGFWGAGDWPDAPPAHWTNDASAIEFIEHATRAELARMAARKYPHARRFARWLIGLANRILAGVEAARNVPPAEY